MFFSNKAGICLAQVKKKSINCLRNTFKIINYLWTCAAIAVTVINTRHFLLVCQKVSESLINRATVGKICKKKKKKFVRDLESNKICLCHRGGTMQEEKKKHESG